MRKSELKLILSALVMIFCLLFSSHFFFTLGPGFKRNWGKTKLSLSSGLPWWLLLQILSGGIDPSLSIYLVCALRDGR
jgi:hypothetical protein